MNVDQLDAGLETVADAIRDLPVVDEQLELALAIRDQLKDAEARISSTRQKLETNIANALPQDSVHIAGVGIVRRRRNSSKTLLPDGKENLLRDVYDSRIADKDTGEVVDETLLDKVLACWDHSPHGIRAGQMEARGLKYDDYVETTWRGWKLEVVREG